MRGRFLAIEEHKIGMAFACVVLFGLVVWISLNASALGFRFADIQPNMEMDYAMGLVWWLLLACAIAMFARESAPMLLAAWIGKFFVVLVAMLFYEYQYGLDAYHYFALKLTGEHWMYPGIDFRKDMIPSLQPLVTPDGGSYGGGIGNENSLRFMLIVASVTGPFYHAMKVMFAFFGLMGSWFFYRAVVVALGRSYPAAFYLLVFFPSIIFWSSILGKDPLQFLFLGLYAYGGALWLVEGRLSAMWFLGLGLGGSYLIRPWTSLMAGSALALATLLGREPRWKVALALGGGLACLPYVWGHVQSMMNFDLTDVYGDGEDNFGGEGASLALEFITVRTQGFAEGGGSGGDLLDATSGGSLQGSLPLAMFTGLFRPLPFDITNPFTALAALENAVVLALALVALYRLRPAFLRDSLVIWPALYSLMWTTLHGFIVMANFGSGVRYKLQTWPFLLMAILILVHKQGRALLESRMPEERGRG